MSDIPVALSDRRERLLNASRRAALDPADDVADSVLWWHADEHINVVARQYPFDDVHLEFGANLPNNLPNPKAKLATQDVIAVCCRPDEGIAVAENCVTTLAGAGSWTSLPSR